jgi:imidazoleglycerol phosphate synthase glutamine amidotransferase subunit HisH
MQKLNEHQLVDVIKQAADKKPFLGICLHNLVSQNC